MNPARCPSPDQLLKLLRNGEADSEATRQLESHLLSCEPCAQTAETLFPQNEVTAFREASPIRFEDPADQVLVDSLISRAKAFRPYLATELPEQTQVGFSPDDNDLDAKPKPQPVNEELTEDDFSYLAPAQQPDELGRLGDYRVLRVLGRGGMGVVFRAEDLRLKRQVALKVMKPSIAASRSAKDRFLREAQFTASIEHDHIVHIYQVGEDRGVPFIAMPFLKGESLKTRLEREGRLPQSEVVRIGKEVAAGLAAAHERGLIHRDIKPDNIWIEEKTGRAKILDFGLVRSVSDDAELTQSGMVLGTPKYMAPEQAQGQNVDHRCDLFSLGSVLYHLATGKPAFEGNNLTATLMAVVHHEPRPIEAVSPDIHPQLASLIAELVKKNRDQRPQSASEVSQRLADIEQILKNPSPVTAGSLETLSNGSRTPIDSIVNTNIAEVTIVPQPVVRRTPPRPPRGNKLALAAGAGGLLLMLGILIITIRNKDGKETTVRVPSGVVADIDVQPGSKVSIREEATGESDTGDPAGMKSTAVADTDLQTRSGKNIQKEASILTPEEKTIWPVGPLPSWAEQTASGTRLKEGHALPGIVERPAELLSTGSWNIDTVHSRGRIEVARYSPDGKWLATGSNDGHVRVYEAATMKLHRLLPGAGGSIGVVDLAWHPDNDRIAVACDCHFNLRIWTVNGALKFEEHGGLQFLSVAWTHDGSRLICAGLNHLAVRAADGSILKTLVEQENGGCFWANIAVSPSSQRFVCWHLDGVRIWNAETFQMEEKLEVDGLPRHGGHAVEWSLKDRIALFLRETVLVFEPDRKSQRKFEIGSAYVAAWHPDGDRLAVWRDSEFLMQLNTVTSEMTPEDQQLSVWSSSAGPMVTAFCWSPDGKHLAGGSGRLLVFNEQLTTPEFDSGATFLEASAISLSTDGRRIATSNRNDNCNRIWSTDGTALSVIPLSEHSLAGTAIAWSPTDNRLATLIFDVNGQGKMLIGTPNGEWRGVDALASTAAWSPDGQRLAVGQLNGHVLITDADGHTLEDIDTGETGKVTVGWSKQGFLVAHVGLKILRIEPGGGQSVVSLVAQAPSVPLEYSSAIWRPDGQEVCFPNSLFVNLADGVTDRIRSAPHASAWPPDSDRYLQLLVGISVNQPDGTQQLLRGENGSHWMVAGAWHPSEDTVFVGYDQSLLMARNADDLHVKWTAVVLPEQQSLTFHASGSILDGKRSTLEKHLVYYTADSQGNVDLLTPDEFELRFGQEVLPEPGRYFDAEFGFTLNTGDVWKPAPLESFTVPGVARAAFTKTGGVSLNVFIQETGELVDASWMLAESAKAQEEKLSATVLEKEVRKVAGRDAMWMVVEGQGTGSAIDGKGSVKTTQHWIAIPREKDVVVALLTSPSGTFANNQALFLQAIETLKLRGVNSTP